MRFDAYSATVHDVPSEVVVEGLSGLLRAIPESGRGKYNYATSERLQRAGETLALVLHGGKNRGVNIQCQGPEAVEVSGFLRSAHPGHVVTRADVCEDFDGPGTWEAMLPVVLGVAEERGIKIDCRGDWLSTDSPGGRTLYLGATSSASRLRLYEKGKELLAKGAPPGSVSLDMVRLEVQTRPEGDSRLLMADAEPSAFWGLADWTRDLAWRCLGLDVERVHVKDVRDLDTDRSIRAMVAQYAGVIDRRGLELGSQDEAIRELVRLFRSELRVRGLR